MLSHNLNYFTGARKTRKQRSSDIVFYICNSHRILNIFRSHCCNERNVKRYLKISEYSNKSKYWIQTKEQEDTALTLSICRRSSALCVSPDVAVDRAVRWDRGMAWERRGPRLGCLNRSIAHFKVQMIDKLPCRPKVILTRKD